MRPAFELAVQDTYGVEVAARLGVDRIELCAALPLGGVTPSPALVEAAVAAGLPVHVLVRPRPGGFEYAPGEAAVIVRDVRHALAFGAAGVVVGGLAAGEIDTELIDRVVEAAAGAPVTFHRAFDALADPAAAVDTLVKLGVRRILTAGGAGTVFPPGLTTLVAAAAGRIEVMAGGGVHPGLVGALVRTGVDAVHASAKRTVADGGGVTLGTAAPSDVTSRETTDEGAAAEILAALRAG